MTKIKKKKFKEGIIMFKEGDFVIYGNKGVCQVKKVGPIDIPGVAKGKLYYTLSQVYLKGSTIFTPVDNDKIKIRKILNREQAEELINEIQEFEPEWIEDDKEREKEFTEVLRCADCRLLFKMIISLYKRREQRIADGKKVTSTDEKYFHAAEDILYGELAIPLGIKKEEVKDYIRSR